MRIKIIITIGGLLFGCNLMAQQLANFSQYFFDPLTVNPAYAGSRGGFSGTLTYRNQWTGLGGAPVTEGLGIHAPVGTSNVGLGLQVINDHAGPMQNTSIAGIFTYTAKLTNTLKLAFGLAATISDINIDFNEISIETANDPSFPTNKSSAWVPDANFGMYLYKENFYAGISANHLIQTDWKLQSAPITAVNTASFYRQYYIIGGYVAKFSEDFALRPSVLVQFVGNAPALEELDCSLIYMKKFYFGLGVRNSFRKLISGSDNEFIPSIEYDFGKGFRLGYSYDAYLSSLGNYSTGTHEIMLGWDMNYGTSKTRMVNPRYF